MSLVVESVKVGSTDQAKDIKANKEKIQINMLLLAVAIALLQKMQTSRIDIPKIENRINVIKAGGSTRASELTPNTPEKKLKPKIIKPISASRIILFTTIIYN